MGIMFTPTKLAEVLDEFDAQYSSNGSNPDDEDKEQQVRTIVAKNIKNESSASKIDKLLALNMIKT